MKKLITIIALVVFTFGFSQSDRKKMHEKIKSEKIAFITERLSLTEVEAAKFWAIYNKYEAARRDIKTKYFRPIKQKMRDNSNVAEADAEKMLGNLILGENKMHESKIGLVQDLKGVIPAMKIIKLKSVEDAFNKKLLERLKKFRKASERK